MAKISKGKSFCWYGYLMAGDRSSPVLQDRRLETGNPKTIYMFNLKRGEIIQYAREIVEQKLRDLKPDETAFIEDLDAGYKKARRSFKGHKTGKRSVTDDVIVPLREDADYGDNDDSDAWLDTREA